MAACDMTLIHERLSTVETSTEYILKDVSEIKKALMGNGQPGLLADMNQWKGGAKLFGIISSACIGLLSIAVAFLAYIK